MKKVIIFIISFLIICFVGEIYGYAETQENDTEQAQKEITQEIERGIKSDTPDEAEDFLEDNDISIDNPESASKVGVGDWLDYILDLVREFLSSPLKLLGALLLVIVFTSVSTGILGSNSKLLNIISIISVLSCTAILFETISNCIEAVNSTISNLSIFIMSYVPIFSSVVATCGNASSGVSYYVIVLFLCEIITFVIDYILVPFVSFSLASSIVEAINPNLSVNGFSRGLLSAAKWTLGLITTIFIGVTSIQSIIGTSVDTVGVKAAKYAASSMIPVVGGAMSDAYSTLMGSLSLIKNSVGVLGIIIILVTALKPVVMVVCLKFTIWISAVIAAFFEQNRICSLLRGINNVLSILLGVVACFTLIFIISTAVVMLLSFNMV